MTLLPIGHAAKCLGPIGHAGKCLDPPYEPISYWSRGKMPGTSPRPYYILVTRQNAWDLLVTRQNAWDLPMTLLPIGHAAKCLGEGDTRQNAWDLPLTLLAIGHAAKCLGHPNDPITY